MASSTVLIGCDPEYFLWDTKTSVFVSAHDKVPGTKDEPYKLANGGHVQADGTAVEFNIPPSRTPKQFKDHILSALNDIKKEFFAKDDNLKFSFSPVADFKPDYFDRLPASAKELGCDPDFSAYNGGKPNPKPNGTRQYRTGSGHIHVGFLKREDFIPQGVEPSSIQEHVDDCSALAIAMDYNLMSFRSLWDKDDRRATMYGNPGCFRPKPYGMEYRTLSNAWLNHPDLWPWLFQASVNAVEFANSKEFENILVCLNPSSIYSYMATINDGTYSEANRIAYAGYAMLNNAIYKGLIHPPRPSLIKKTLVM